MDRKQLFIPSLTFARLAYPARSILTSLLLIEIGKTYQTPIGVTNQINTATSFLSIFTALVLGLLSVKIRHRTLLITGLFIAVVSTIGCIYANSFISLVLVFGLGGIGLAVIYPMSVSIMGDNTTPEERSRALGFFSAAPVALFGIGYPIVNMIGDWKQAFLIFTLPINIIALILSAMFTPPGEAPRSNIAVFSAYQKILKNKSALGCLIGNGFGLAALSIMPSLSASYFRETYGIARGLVIYIIIAMCFANVVGSLTVRRFSRGVGYKKTMIFFTLIQGVLTFLMFAEFGTTISLVFGLLAALVNGMYSPTAIGLVMEQFPELRGAVLSLNAAFGSIGGMLGLSVSGFLLLEYSWRIMGVLPIFLGMVSGLVVYLLVRGIHLQPLSQ